MQVPVLEYKHQTKTIKTSRATLEYVANGIQYRETKTSLSFVTPHEFLNNFPVNWRKLDDEQLQKALDDNKDKRGWFTNSTAAQASDERGLI